MHSLDGLERLLDDIEAHLLQLGQDRLVQVLGHRAQHTRSLDFACDCELANERKDATTENEL